MFCKAEGSGEEGPRQQPVTEGREAHGAGGRESLVWRLTPVQTPAGEFSIGSGSRFQLPADADLGGGGSGSSSCVAGTWVEFWTGPAFGE